MATSGGPPPDAGVTRGARILVTGAGGFVASWAQPALLNLAPGATLWAAGPAPPAPMVPGVTPAPLDVTDRGAVEALVRAVRPTAVLHLAAVSAIGEARRDPRRAWAVNLTGTMNLAYAVLDHVPGCRFVHVSTSETYGAAFNQARTPLDETAALAPTNAYAASKAAADLLIGQLAAEGLDAVRFRPFNHTGPRQSADFVVAAFSRQIARIEAGLQPPVIEVGNLEAVRDFLDVRDVVQAYAAAIADPAPRLRGAILNLASGEPRRIGAILDALLALSPVSVAVASDAARMRPSDVPRAVGQARRAADLLGWGPRIPWERTLADVLDHWRAVIRDGG